MREESLLSAVHDCADVLRVCEEERGPRGRSVLFCQQNLIAYVLDAIFQSQDSLPWLTAGYKALQLAQSTLSRVLKK